MALIARLYGQAAFFLFIYKSFEADDTQMLSVLVFFLCVCDSHSALSYSKYLDQHSTHHCHFSLTDSSKIRRLGFMISILATILEEKLILAVTHKPVFYDLTLKNMFL